MYRQFGNADYRNQFAELGHDGAAIVRSGQLDALVATARAALPADTAEMAWQQGSAMDAGRAVAYAIGEEPRPVAGG